MMLTDEEPLAGVKAQLPELENYPPLDVTGISGS